MTEWRVIPEFPRYEITEDGDVRNRETKKKLNETENQKTGVWSYALWYGRSGTPTRSTHRTHWTLICDVYPDKVLVGWKPIPNFPGYLVNKQGEVMGTRFYKKLAKTSSSAYVLRKDGKRHHWYFYEIASCTQKDWNAFWGEEEQEVA